MSSYWKARRNKDGSVWFNFTTDKAIPLDAKESEIGTCAVTVEMTKGAALILADFLSLEEGSFCECWL